MVNIWRRRWVTATVGAVLLCGACLAAAGPTRSVDEFGAVPDDGKDDTAAFMAALKACAATPGSTLSLSPGRYDLAMRTDPPDGASPPLLVIKKAQGLTIDGRDAEIVCHDHAPLFWFENCSDVQIRNLKIDYDPLPFTAGQIIADGDGYHDLKVEEHHPMHEGFRVESMLPYDPLRKRMGLIKDDLYQREFPNRIEKISERVLRIPVKRKLFKTGDWVIVRHQIYSKNAFNFTDCQTVTVQDVTVYTCPGMALMSRGGGDVTLRKFNVMIKPGSGRWFSATADATHFSDTRGKVVLEDCLLEGMGDDGVNVHGMYSVITEVIDARTFKIAVAKDKRWSVVLPRPGDVLEIGRGPDPLSPMTTAKVASADGGEDDKVVTIVLTAPAVQPLMSGDVVGNAVETPEMTFVLFEDAPDVGEQIATPFGGERRRAVFRGEDDVVDDLRIG